MTSFQIEKVARKIQRKGYSFSAGQIMEMLQMQARYASVSISQVCYELTFSDVLLALFLKHIHCLQMKRFGRLLKFTHSYNYIIKEEENNDIVIATAHGVTTNATQEFAPTHYWWCSSQDLPKGYFTIAPVGDYRQRQRMLCMPFASQISEAVRRMNQHLMHRTVKLMSVSV